MGNGNIIKLCLTNSTLLTKISIIIDTVEEAYRYGMEGDFFMNKISTKKIALTGLMIAVVFLVTYFTKIPGPVGPFNIGDAAIIVTAIVIGRNSGLVAGAIGSALADLAMGYAIFSPITFIVKGLEGYIVGVIASDRKEKRSAEYLKIFAAILGAVIMVGGYFLAELFILKHVDKSFGYSKAITDLPYNLVQGGVSAAVGYALSTALSKSGVSKLV
jgi:uncharacterized membrane protein